MHMTFVLRSPSPGARHDTRRECFRLAAAARRRAGGPLGQRRCAAGRKRVLSLQNAKMQPRSAAWWPRSPRSAHPCYMCCSRGLCAVLRCQLRLRVHRHVLNATPQHSGFRQFAANAHC
ncbi:unnamed protein product [Pelagomonas calceolata]|uniref:Uncharacterized protein n=1 Tax=Pelagomonas calceolata TaxID=35677 RepID=A0A8J2SEH1_9STRA|nr:unnamed protein product [Pelagomonas calceolata]